jgi:hypothetical protein
MPNHYHLVLVAQRAVNFHRQCATAAVAAPTGDCGNIHAGLQAMGCQQMAQVPVGDLGSADCNVRGESRRVDSPAKDSAP